MIRIALSAAAPEREALERAARVIRAGGLVAVATDTLYGLAADPFNDEAVERVFAVKGRTADRALPLIAGDAAQVTSYLGTLPPVGAVLAARFWPGPLTLVVLAPSRLSPGVTGGTGRVGIRVPAHAVARGLCETCGHPLTATSANPSGAEATARADVVERSLPRVDVLLDSGPAPGGPPSTVVDVSEGSPRLIRPGAVAWEDITACAVTAS